MKTTLFEDANHDEFTVTTYPDMRTVELAIMDPAVSVLEIGPDIAPKVASLILSTFGEDVGVEFRPDGSARVHAGNGPTRVVMGLPADAEEREEMLNLAITAMGAINAYDAKVEREREEARFMKSLEDLVDGLFSNLKDEDETEDAEALDQEALALHNAYYSATLEEPWTLEKLREDDPYDLDCFRRAAQAARTVYAQATTTVAS